MSAGPLKRCVWRIACRKDKWAFRRTGSLLGLFLSMFLLLSVNGRAIGVSQSQIRVVVSPVQTHSFSFELINDESSTLHVALSIVDWMEDSEGVTTILPPGSHARSVASDTTLSETDVTLVPGESTTITIDATLGPTANGTYWAGCLVQEVVNPDLQDGSSIAVRRQLLIRLMYTTPDARTSARVVRVWVSGSNPMAIHAKVENDGTVALEPISSLFTAENTEGQTVFESSSSVSLLPGVLATVSIPAPWTTDESGTFLIRAVFDFGGDALVAGQIVLRLQPLSLVPIGTADAPPQDLDGDGWYEDIDGNGVHDSADVELLSESLDDPGITENVRAFDFDNDGRITSSDPVALAQRYYESSS